MGKKLSKVAGAVATGGTSLIAKPVLNKLGLSLDGKEGEYVTPEQQQAALYRAFANDYDNQMGLADKGVMESELTKDLYGQGGLQDRLNTEERQLASQGFKLTPEDMSAYGQVAGDIARQFGQQEQQAAQSLARRGLASAGSGTAGALYSGIAGNKNEMLAKAQTDIAQRRYQDTVNRLQQTRNQMQSLGLQGSQLAQQRYNTKGSSLLNAANVEAAGNEARRAALADKEAAYKPGLFGTIGQGLQAGIGNLASAAPGMLAGGAGGGAASSGATAAPQRRGMFG